MVRAAPDAPAGGVVAVLNLPVGRPVIAVNGGTDDLAPPAAAALRRAMSGVATVAVQREATLVTGATNAGVFSLLGAALEQVDADYVCVGVAPAALTTWPGKTRDAAVTEPLVPLEAHHTHFVAVEAAQWGVETPMMMGIVSTVSAGMPTVAVIAGGGHVATQEVRAHLSSERPVILLKGSGRLADRLAALVRDPKAATGELADVVARRDLLDVCDPVRESATLERIVWHRLGEV